MSSADGLDAGLRQAEMLDLALDDQLLDGAGDVFDRHVEIDTMLVEQVDAICLQALERRLRHGLDMLGAAVGAAGARARGAN
jgi:hypothetical protein